MKQRVNRVLRRSVEYAFAHRTASLDYVRAHAQEMSEDVMYRHIDLYVNEYSVDLGAEGRRAVELLFEKAAATGIIPPRRARCFSRLRKNRRDRRNAADRPLSAGFALSAVSSDRVRARRRRRMATMYGCDARLTTIVRPKATSAHEAASAR